MRNTSTAHSVGTREQWLAARLDLLAAEKAHTRHSDELARRRQALPWVRVETAHRFATDAGVVSLADLFRGCSQLLVYHFMFGEDYTAGCPSCSMIADGFDGFATHLAQHDVMLWAVSRAPLARLLAFRRRMGWSFPWASSLGSGFNAEFGVHIDEREQRAGGAEYNYRREAAMKPTACRADCSEGDIASSAGVDMPTFLRERPGMSAFALQDGDVFHTYSTYARGLDGLWGAYQWLDRAPKGRNESGVWWRHRDAYDMPVVAQDGSCCG